MTWAEFQAVTHYGAIALDGLVTDGPGWNDERGIANFDHHNGCVREATMSTAMQVMFAIKGGLMENLRRFEQVSVWMNDPDQDTSLASWLLKHYYLFEGVQSHPQINRLLALNDRLDITGGAYPMRLNDDVLEMHNWVFEPYSDLRISGSLAVADIGVLRNCVDAIHGRLGAVLAGNAGRRAIRSEAKIVSAKDTYWLVDEVGGNEARYTLFNQGMKAFVSRVATRPDGRFVYSIGKRSQYVRFPLKSLYGALSKAEEIAEPWGGSNIIGGSPRSAGSRLDWPELSEIVERVLRRHQEEQT